jgi:hypothetical protein
MYTLDQIASTCIRWMVLCIIFALISALLPLSSRIGICQTFCGAAMAFIVTLSILGIKEVLGQTPKPALHVSR